MKAHRVLGAKKALSVGLIAVVYIFGRPFVANGAGGSSGLTSVIALQQPDGAPAAKARGTVTIRQTAASQEFSVDVRGIVPTENTPPGGLGVFWTVFPFTITNFVTALDGSTNGHWTLDLTSNAGAPSQLGVADVTDLFGSVVLIADGSTNRQVYLQTVIPPFVANPSSLSYKKKIKLTRPADSPSPDARGTLTVKLDGARGTSFFDVNAKKLATGNSYCLWLLPALGTPTPTCPDGSNTLRSTVRFRRDTSKGGELFDGILSNGVVRIDQLSGLAIEIHDGFGTTHLQGIIP